MVLQPGACSRSPPQHSHRCQGLCWSSGLLPRPLSHNVLAPSPWCTDTTVPGGHTPLTSCHSRTPLQARSLLETDCCPPRAEAPSWPGGGALMEPGATAAAYKRERGRVGLYQFLGGAA